MSIYDQYGGFLLNMDSEGNGVVVAKQNQGKSSWVGVPNMINLPENHDELGRKFTDWRLPTKDELNQMYRKRGSLGLHEKDETKKFTGEYWSSEQSINEMAWTQKIPKGDQQVTRIVYPEILVRAVRDFKV
jgi:hypothetical protein